MGKPVVYPRRFLSRKIVDKTPQGRFLRTNSRRFPNFNVADLNPTQGKPHKGSGDFRVLRYPKGFYGKTRQKRFPAYNSLFNLLRVLEERGLGKYLVGIGEKNLGRGRRAELISAEARGKNYLTLIRQTRGNKKARYLREVGFVEGEFQRNGIITGRWEENHNRLRNYVRTPNGKIKFIDIDPIGIMVTKGVKLWDRIEFLRDFFEVLQESDTKSKYGIVSATMFKNYVEGYVRGLHEIPFGKPLSPKQQRIVDLYFIKTMEDFGFANSLVKREKERIQAKK
ncbi:MAG: hypothetical protein HY392_01365 [Candidatus Diapherotrites archaeon]|nr:hypothetical protein [Candidatus Diapherotrites archaeon]